MCGIIGIVGSTPVCGDIVAGLKRLEYRGYDSAGIATIHEGKLHRQRAVGKLLNLEGPLAQTPLPGNIGIGHTRWATHGTPSEQNAHPHHGKHLMLAHNGIIENYTELRRRFENISFHSETDSEIVVHLLETHLERGLAYQEAVSATLEELDGSYALAILFEYAPDLIIGARSGSPLVVGYGKDGRKFLASDAMALAPFCDEITYLEEGDWVELYPNRVVIHPDRSLSVVERPRNPVPHDCLQAEKGPYRHFMQKEIAEQPHVLQKTIKAYDFIGSGHSTALGKDTERLSIIACGTSYYAGCTAKFWFEQFAGIPVDVEIASEFRYSESIFSTHSKALFISQSGETADTLAALRQTKQRGIPTIALVNVPESSIAREADTVLQTYAGPEIGVASTKAFTTQLAVLFVQAIAAGRAREKLTEEEAVALWEDLKNLPSFMSKVLQLDARLQDLVPHFSHARSALYLARGVFTPIALEGALKLKEISYIHAEGYAAGELKHGPIALIDDRIPIVALAPKNALYEKILSNVQEVVARQGQVYLFTDAAGTQGLGFLATRVTVVTLPTVPASIAPIVYSVPMQMLAYAIASFKGTDVDQPRNLAKSVTVE